MYKVDLDWAKGTTFMQAVLSNETKVILGLTYCEAGHLRLLLNRIRHSCKPVSRRGVDYVTPRGFKLEFNEEDFGYLLWRKRNCCAF
jgi:hypothetical protein